MKDCRTWGRYAKIYEAGTPKYCHWILGAVFWMGQILVLSLEDVRNTQDSFYV